MSGNEGQSLCREARKRTSASGRFSTIESRCRSLDSLRSLGMTTGPPPHPRTPHRPLLLRSIASGPILNHMVQYPPDLDSVFTAVADSTRRGILERLGRREASISELAEQFEMTLTG